MKKYLMKIIEWYKQYKTLDTVLWFGKYKNHSIRDIVDCDVQYISWCLENKIFKLKIFTKIYYSKKLNTYCENRRKLLLSYYEFIAIHGEWLDDGHGNCGFAKEETFY